MRVLWDGDCGGDSVMPEPLKPIKSEIWFLDIETVPCVETGRKVYGGDFGDDNTRFLMFDKAGATPENPEPFLKTVFHKVVCVSVLCRQITKDGIRLTLNSFTGDETEILETVLGKIGTRKPQVVGFNTSGFDLTVLYQRAVIHGLRIKQYCERPAKPWDPTPDYFSAANDYNVDLQKMAGGWGKETPSLVEICRACGIPAKTDCDGSNVLTKYLKGDIKGIAEYCESDVTATYLLWLRLAVVCGYLDQQDADAEGIQLDAMLTKAEGATA